MRDPQSVGRNRLTLSRRFTILIIAATLAFGASGAYLQQRSLYREKEIATRHAVEVAYGVMEHFGRLAQEGQLSDAAAQTAAAAAIQDLRYERADYFWINDMHPRVVMHPVNAAERRGMEYGKPVEIGDDVWVGGGAIILPGVRIGSRTIIGAGSVVTRDVPDDVFAAGNPCRVVRAIEQ